MSQHPGIDDEICRPAVTPIRSDPLMTRVAVFAALQWECRPVLRQLRAMQRQVVDGFAVWTGTAPGRQIDLIKTGIGMGRAAAAAATVAALGPHDVFLSTGCAGGLVPGLAPGYLTIPTRIVARATGDAYETDLATRTQLTTVAARVGLTATFGPLLCSARALRSGADKLRAGEQTGAVAVEMEGAAIAAFARQAGVPFAAVRAILDPVDSALDLSPGLVDPLSGTPRPLAVARYLATQRRALPTLFAMQRMMHAAQTSLDTFFHAWLRGP